MVPPSGSSADPRRFAHRRDTCLGERRSTEQDVRGSEQTSGRRIRQASRARCALRGRCRRGPARGPHRPARSRRGPAGRPPVHRRGAAQGDRRRRHPLGHAGPDGRQDRQRPPGRDAGRHRRRPRPQRHPAGRDPDGGPAGLGQDHHVGQDRLSPEPGPAGHGGRVRRQLLDQAQGHDGLARHAPPGRAAAAQDPGRADRRADPADRAAGDAARHHPARPGDGAARRLRRPDPRHRRPAVDRRRADEGGRRHQRPRQAARRRCSSPTP